VWWTAGMVKAFGGLVRGVLACPGWPHDTLCYGRESTGSGIRGGIVDSWKRPQTWCFFICLWKAEDNRLSDGQPVPWIDGITLASTGKLDLGTPHIDQVPCRIEFRLSPGPSGVVRTWLRSDSRH
jgi:hypothetical protein